MVLTECQMKHATEKQLREVREGCRQVCQWIKGSRQTRHVGTSTLRRLSCDPKTTDGFCDAETGERIDAADLVVLTEKGAFYR